MIGNYGQYATWNAKYFAIKCSKFKHHINPIQVCPSVYIRTDRRKNGQCHFIRHSAGMCTHTEMWLSIFFPLLPLPHPSTLPSADGIRIKIRLLCLLHIFSAYITVNTLHLHYKYQSFNSVCCDTHTHAYMYIQDDSKRLTQFHTSIFPELYMVCEWST